LGAGFVSEWLLVQSLIHTAAGHDTVVALTTPLAVGRGFALTTGLGVAAIGQGVRDRVPGPPALRAGRPTRARLPAEWLPGMTIAALACVVLAVAPMIFAPALRRALGALPAGRGCRVHRLRAVVRLPGLHGSIATRR